MFASLALLALAYPPQAPTHVPMPPQYPVSVVVMPPQVPDAADLVKVKTCPCSDQCTCGCNEGRSCRCESRPAVHRTQATPLPVALPVVMPATSYAPTANYFQPQFQQSFSPLMPQAYSQPFSMQRSFMPTVQQSGSFRGSSASC
jgi:hypothetical protein